MDPLDGTVNLFLQTSPVVAEHCPSEEQATAIVEPVLGRALHSSTGQADGCNGIALAPAPPERLAHALIAETSFELKACNSASCRPKSSPALCRAPATCPAAVAGGVGPRSVRPLPRGAWTPPPSVTSSCGTSAARRADLRAGAGAGVSRLEPVGELPSLTGAAPAHSPPASARSCPEPGERRWSTTRRSLLRRAPVISSLDSQRQPQGSLIAMFEGQLLHQSSGNNSRVHHLGEEPSGCFHHPAVRAAQHDHSGRDRLGDLGNDVSDPLTEVENDIWHTVSRLHVENHKHYTYPGSSLEAEARPHWGILPKWSRWTKMSPDSLEATGFEYHPRHPASFTLSASLWVTWRWVSTHPNIARHPTPSHYTKPIINGPSHPATCSTPPHHIMPQCEHKAGLATVTLDPKQRHCRQSPDVFCVHPSNSHPARDSKLQPPAAAAAPHCLPAQQKS